MSTVRYNMATMRNFSVMFENLTRAHDPKWTRITCRFYTMNNWTSRPGKQVGRWSVLRLSLHLPGGTSWLLYRSSDEELVHANSWPQDGRDSPLSLRDGQPKNTRFNSCHRYRMFSTVIATERPGPQAWSTHLQLRTKLTVNEPMPPPPQVTMEWCFSMQPQLPAVSDNELWATCDWTHANVWPTLGVAQRVTETLAILNIIIAFLSPSR